MLKIAPREASAFDDPMQNSQVHHEQTAFDLAHCDMATLQETYDEQTGNTELHKYAQQATDPEATKRIIDFLLNPHFNRDQHWISLLTPNKQGQHCLHLLAQHNPATLLMVLNHMSLKDGGFIADHFAILFDEDYDGHCSLDYCLEKDSDTFLDIISIGATFFHDNIALMVYLQEFYDEHGFTLNMHQNVNSDQQSSDKLEYVNQVCNKTIFTKEYFDSLIPLCKLMTNQENMGAVSNYVKHAESIFDEVIIPHIQYYLSQLSEQEQQDYLHTLSLEMFHHNFGTNEICAPTFKMFARLQYLPKYACFLEGFSGTLAVINKFVKNYLAYSEIQALGDQIIISQAREKMLNWLNTVFKREFNCTPLFKRVICDITYKISPYALHPIIKACLKKLIDKDEYLLVYYDSFGEPKKMPLCKVLHIRASLDNDVNPIAKEFALAGKQQWLYILSLLHKDAKNAEQTLDFIACVPQVAAQLAKMTFAQNENILHQLFRNHELLDPDYVPLFLEALYAALPSEQFISLLVQENESRRIPLRVLGINNQDYTMPDYIDMTADILSFDDQSEFNQRRDDIHYSGGIKWHKLSDQPFELCQFTLPFAINDALIFRDNNRYFNELILLMLNKFKIIPRLYRDFLFKEQNVALLFSLLNGVIHNKKNLEDIFNADDCKAIAKQIIKCAGKKEMPFIKRAERDYIIAICIRYSNTHAPTVFTELVRILTGLLPDDKNNLYIHKQPQNNDSYKVKYPLYFVYFLKHFQPHGVWFMQGLYSLAMLDTLASEYAYATKRDNGQTPKNMTIGFESVQEYQLICTFIGDCILLAEQYQEKSLTADELTQRLRKTAEKAIISLANNKAKKANFVHKELPKPEVVIGYLTNLSHHLPAENFAQIFVDMCEHYSEHVLEQQKVIERWHDKLAKDDPNKLNEMTIAAFTMQPKLNISEADFAQLPDSYYLYRVSSARYMNLPLSIQFYFQDRYVHEIYHAFTPFRLLLIQVFKSLILRESIFTREHNFALLTCSPCDKIKVEAKLKPDFATQLQKAFFELTLDLGQPINAKQTQQRFIQFADFCDQLAPVEKQTHSGLFQRQQPNPILQQCANYARLQARIIMLHPGKFHILSSELNIKQLAHTQKAKTIELIFEKLKKLDSVHSGSILDAIRKAVAETLAMTDADNSQSNTLNYAIENTHETENNNNNATNKNNHENIEVGQRGNIQGKDGFDATPSNHCSL